MRCTGLVMEEVYPEDGAGSEEGREDERKRDDIETGNNPQFRSPRSDELHTCPFSRGDLNCYHRCAIWSVIREEKEDFPEKWLDYPHSRNFREFILHATYL